MWILRKNSGFTIVELLIVIIVIGILAAIVIVAYNGVTSSANRASATAEAIEWQKLFELYRDQYGDLPSLTTGNYYCLGTGFPNSYCRYTLGPGASSYDESSGAGITTELSKVGTPPQNSRKVVSSSYAGPYLRVTATQFIIYTFMPGSDTQVCGKLGLIHDWINGASTTVQCRIEIQR